MMCQHCADPPCVDVCPTGASFKRADGIVLVDRHTCIGCRYCMMACPYGARSFVHEPVTNQKPDVPRGKGCVESCTLCVHRIDHDRIPACVEACAAEGHKALLFGDLNDPKSEIAQRIAAVAADAGARRPQARHRPCATRASEIRRAMTPTATASRRTPLLDAVRRSARSSCSPGSMPRTRWKTHGHIVTGMNNQIVWGLPHVFAIFLIVAASGVLNVASDRLGVRQAGVQAARAAVGPALPRAAGRRARRADARSRPAGAHHRRGDALQLHVGVRLEHVPLLRHGRDRRRLSVDADGAAHGSTGRAPPASRPSRGGSS